MEDIKDVPLFELFGQPDKGIFFTPVTAWIRMMRQLGFKLEAEGLVETKANVLLTWPPESTEEFAHRLRNAMRTLMLSRSSAAPHVPGGQIWTRPDASAGAHRAQAELTCPLCEQNTEADGKDGLVHAIWECESISVATAAMMPSGAENWPLLFRKHALATENMQMSWSDIEQGQDYMSRVLLERRQLQLPLDEANKRRAKRARV
eukprot:4147465-Amphidinium_carterae.2